MKPTITISNMTLNIRLDDILESLSKDDRLELIRMVAMDEPLMRDIIEQLADGCTHDGSSVDDYFLNDLRIKLMPLMGEVAKEAIRNLVQERDLAKADAKRHNDWAYQLYHAWPDSDWRRRPPMPDWQYTPKISDEDAREIAGVEAPSTESDDMPEPAGM